MTNIQKKILIVEDDLQISKVYEIQLSKAGLTTFLARNGEEALNLFNTEKPDIIILDLMIPKKDGFWVLEEVNKNNKTSVPILVISNLGQKDDEDRALSLGATEYLVKIDYSIQNIVDKVKKYLNL